MADAPVQKISSEKLLLLLSQRRISLGDRRLRQLADEGYFPQPVRGEYEFLATLLGLIEHYKTVHQKESGNLKAEALRIKVAERKIKEVDAARAENSVEDVGEVERSRVAMVMLVRSRLLGLPVKLSGRLAAFNTQAQIQSALEKEIEDVLHQLSDPAFIARPDPEPENGSDQ